MNQEMTAKPVRKTDAEKENHNQAYSDTHKGGR